MGTFEGDIAAVMAEIVALIPAKPAAALGRHEPSWQHRTDGTRASQGLHALDGELVERLLGALELAVARLTIQAPASVVERVGPPTGTFSRIAWDGEAEDALSLVELVHPGATDIVVELVKSLRDKAFAADATGDEEAVSAAHGAAHLALAVAVSAAVLRAIGETKPAAIVGVALGAGSRCCRTRRSRPRSRRRRWRSAAASTATARRPRTPSSPATGSGSPKGRSPRRSTSPPTGW